MNERGKFIVFEGVGGSGKSTQLARAQNYFETEFGQKAIFTREPGGIPEAEHIRELIFELKSKNLINSDHQLALFFASRKIWMECLVKPALREGSHVLSDRTYFSTGAYQGYAEGANLELINSIANVVVGEYKPNGVILLDVQTVVAKTRNAIKNERDPYDEEELSYFQKVVDGYKDMAQKNWGDVPWFVINGELSEDEVEVQVKDCLRTIMAI
jgi:dTMP kinase